MVFAQYSNFLSLFVFSLFLVPKIVLGMLGKRIKWYGAFISVPTLCLIYGTQSKQMLQFLVFLIFELLLIAGYYYLKKRISSKRVYIVIFGLSILPILLIKVTAHFFALNFLGFIGISYISFRVWQLIIEIHDGNIKFFSLLTVFYFITFFPTISSGPIDRYNRFNEDLNKNIERTQYLNDYVFIGLKKIFRGAIYKFLLAAVINVCIIEKLPQEKTVVSIIIYMYAYTLYLFFDFAGYSDFASEF